MNKVLAENKADKTVDYVQYIKDSCDKAIKEAFTCPVLSTEQAKDWNPDLENQVAK